MKIKTALDAYLQLIGMAVPSARTTTDRTRYLREFFRWSIQGSKLCALDMDTPPNLRSTLSMLSVPETTAEEVAKLLADMRSRPGDDLSERIRLLRAHPSKFDRDDDLRLMRRWRDQVLLPGRGRKAALARWNRKPKPAGSKKVLGARKKTEN